MTTQPSIEARALAALLADAREALRPFARAWVDATKGKAPTTLAEFGAVAKHHTSAVDFRRASDTLARIEQAAVGE